MCGISAVVTLDKRSQNTAIGLNQGKKKANGDTGTHGPYNATIEAELNESLDRITHRGPDARGIWIGRQGKVGKKNQILSVLCHGNHWMLLALFDIHAVTQEASLIFSHCSFGPLPTVYCGLIHRRHPAISLT